MVIVKSEAAQNNCFTVGQYVSRFWCLKSIFVCCGMSGVPGCPYPDLWQDSSALSR